jgi:predicted phosphoribosyltransferase
MEQVFRDRYEAGRVLAALLGAYANRPDALDLALPRGGVPVGFEVARTLHLPLDIFLARKLGVPGHEELAMGAIASGGIRVLNPRVVDALRLQDSLIELAAARELKELQRRELAYRAGRPASTVAHKTVILIDDGLATGASMRAAAEALRQQDTAAIVVAVPVAAPKTCEELRDRVDQIVCAVTPDDFQAVGQWYENFEQTTEEEVRDLLALADGALRTEEGGTTSHHVVSDGGPA